VRFDETESAVTRRVFRCDGHAYEHMIEYDLAEAFDRLAYERKLDTFIEGFGKARDSADGRVYADRDSGHRVFRRGDLLFVFSNDSRPQRAVLSARPTQWRG